MKTIFECIRQQLRQGNDLVLVSVIASSGATPRGAGARMLVGPTGRLCGTIGGGAVEYRSGQMARQVLEEKSSRDHAFALNRKDVENLGMICGGDAQVFFHYIPAGDGYTLELAERALEAMAQHQSLWLLSDIAQGGRLSLYSHELGFWGTADQPWMLPSLDAHPRHLTPQGQNWFVEQISTAGRVYIFGGGHVAQALAPVLSSIQFRCVVMDDRPEFASPELFPGAESVILGDFRRIADYVSIGPEDYVCVMTRGHAYDTVVQAQVLRCCPKYCGVIGSAGKAAGVRRVLKEDYGLSDQELDRVTTPIGLKLRAETPAEIAISIAAQLIPIRRGG